MIFFLQLLFVKRIERESVKRTIHQDSPVDYGNGLFIQHPGKPFVGSGVWHQGVQSSDFVLGFPFFQCFITVGNDGAIGQSQRRSSDPFVVGSRQTFYDNQPFIDWKELNRIEEACRLIYSNIVSRDQGRKTLAFILNGGDF